MPAGPVLVDANRGLVTPRRRRSTLGVRRALAALHTPNGADGQWRMWIALNLVIQLRRPPRHAMTQAWALDRNDRVRLDAPRDPRRGPDHRVVADRRLPAQDRGVGINDHAVLDRRMPL